MKWDIFCVYVCVGRWGGCVHANAVMQSWILDEGKCHSENAVYPLMSSSCLLTLRLSLNRSLKKRRPSPSGCTVDTWRRKRSCRSTTTRASSPRPPHPTPRATQSKTCPDYTESKWYTTLWSSYWGIASTLPQPTSGWTSFFGSSVVWFNFGDAHSQAIIV